MSQRKLDHWIRAYLECTENTEPHPLYHTWVAISTIAACLKRKCWINWGFKDIYPNFYIALVGPPGGRKGTAMTIGRGMLDRLNIVVSSDCVTQAALVLEIEDAKDNHSIMLPNPETGQDEKQEYYHHSLTVVGDELALFLRDSDPMMLTTLTDLYDCKQKWRYTTKNKGKSSLQNVWLNIIGGITPSLLRQALSGGAVGGGLASRFIFVVAQGAYKDVPLAFPTVEEIRLYEHLVEDLNKIQMIRGPFSFTKDALQSYVDWYQNRHDQELSDGQFTGYNARRADHFRKLLMVVSVATSNDRIITQAHFNEAMSILLETEAQMPWAFRGVGRGEHAEIVGDIASYIALRQRVTRKDIIKHFQMDALPEDIDLYLNAMHSTGMVRTQAEDNVHYYYWVGE